MCGSVGDVCRSSGPGHGPLWVLTPPLPRYIHRPPAACLACGAGSLTAGIICGYLSHVPNNLSTLKLLHPEKSYTEHTKGLISASYRRVPATVPKTARWAVASFLALAAPAGLMVRTTQIAGSFCIINGVITAMSNRNEQKK